MSPEGDLISITKEICIAIDLAPTEKILGIKPGHCLITWEYLEKLLESCQTHFGNLKVVQKTSGMFYRISEFFKKILANFRRMLIEIFRKSVYNSAWIISGFSGRITG